MKDLIKTTNIKDINEWFIIYKNMETSLDHNGTYSIDSLFVFSTEKLDEILIYLSQMDNSLNSYKYFNKITLSDALSQKKFIDISLKAKDISNIHKYTKEFQSFILTNKLEHNLTTKNIVDKKIKL